MLTCRQTSELVSQSLDRRLSLRERIGVRMHLLICAMCARAKEQVEFLHRAAREYARLGTVAAQPLRLSPAGRERIREALQRVE